VNDGVELIEASALEGQFGDARAVEGAVGRDDFRAEPAHDLVVDLMAGLHQRAAQLVGLNDLAPSSRR